MYLWEPLLDYAKTHDNELKFYFIFYPATNITKIRSAMMISTLDYPILIDENGDFENMNPRIPKEQSNAHVFVGRKQRSDISRKPAIQQRN